jgi:hydrogenase nickel incorporation protein HypB
LDDFVPRKAEHHLRHLASRAPVLEVSSKNGEGMAVWLAWLRAEVNNQRDRVAAGKTVRPAVQGDGARLHATETAAHHHHAHGHAHDHGHK